MADIRIRKRKRLRNKEVKALSEELESVLGVPVFSDSEPVDRAESTDMDLIIVSNDILGFIDNKNQVELHKRNCPVASKLKSSYGNRILDAKWEMHQRMLFDATIEIRGIDRKGMLHDLAEVISGELDVNIHKITVSSDEGIFDGLIKLRVHDRNEVKNIMEQLKKIDGLKEVQQIM